MAVLRRISPRPLQILAGVALALVLTGCLWASGVISTAPALAAYATSVLAVGTVALAGGTIGLFSEQRNANRLLTDQARETQRQLERAQENNIAQVAARRLTGQGQRVRVTVINGTQRAIRSVYVWVHIDGMTGHYETIVVEPDERTGQDIRSRRMQHIRRLIDDFEVSHCYRSMLPGDERTFTQYAVTNPQETPSGISESTITAYAMFTDADGIWWKTTEDGEVLRLQAEPPLIVNPPPLVLPTGLTRLPGIDRFRPQHRQLPADVTIVNPGTG
jgi:hypothetical protein